MCLSTVRAMAGRSRTRQNPLLWTVRRCIGVAPCTVAEDRAGDHRHLAHERARAHVGDEAAVDADVGLALDDEVALRRDAALAGEGGANRKMDLVEGRCQAAEVVATQVVEAWQCAERGGA